MTRSNDSEVLAGLREKQRARGLRWRKRAALVVGGLTLDTEHVHALKTVQKTLHAPSRAAAIRAAIMLAAEVAERSKHHEQAK